MLVLFDRYVLNEKRKILLSFQFTINPRSIDTITPGATGAAPDKATLM